MNREAPVDGKIRRQAWAIVRVDTTHSRRDTPFPRVVTVKKVVLTEAYAKAEVERLNLMNAAKGCQYVAQLTELDESVTPEADAP
jgi:hypothetical protein